MTHFRPNRRSVLRLGAGLTALAGALPGIAQTPAFPTRPVRLVVPFPPGGSSDVLGRLVATQLGQRLGQPVVVENRAGAGGTLAMQQVGRGEADGYTIAQGAAGNMSFAPALMSPAPYDPVEAFAPIAIVASDANGLFVNAALPIRTMADLLAYVRAQPNPVPYASAGAGTPAHLGLAVLAQSRNLAMTHVPYRGAAPAITDVAAGVAAMIFTSVIAGRSLADAGRLRLIAVSARNRLPDFPDVPTMREAGFPELELAIWYGYFAAPTTPAPILARYRQVFTEMLRDPAFATELRRVTMEPFAPEQGVDNVRRVLADSVVEVRRQIEATGVKME